MDCIVLDSKPDNQYGDSPTEYLFPSRYLRVFEPLKAGRPLFVLIYEPKGQSRASRGRQSYVGWASISSPPERVTDAAGDRPRWRVRYDFPYHPFPNPVARRLGGEALESALRGGQQLQIGNAVRSIPQLEAQGILELAFGGTYWPTTEYAPSPPDSRELELVARERVSRMVTTIQRDARFSDRVIAAYEGTCAVSGFAVGSIAPAKSFGLLDAAHIRPVQESGPDDPSNGLALTPTLHRMFDAGLFSFEGPADRLVVVRSRHLEERMIRSPDGRSAIALDDGSPVRLPAHASSRPSLEMVRWHRVNALIR